MQEASGEDISERVEELLTEIDEKQRIQDCCSLLYLAMIMSDRF